MTTEELSNTYDTLLNSYHLLAGIGETHNRSDLALDEYEKSVFLTKSQEGLIVDLYSGKNIFGDSFEKTEEIRRYLSSLVVTETLESINYRGGLSLCSKFFKLSDDLLFLTYEAFKVWDTRNKCNNGKTLEVLPVSLDEFHRIVENPFRGVNSRRVLRLDVSNNVVEIVSKYDGLYLVRYIRKPKPIILTELPNGLTIGGKSSISECELNPILHNSILDRAVKLTLISKGYSINN